MYLYNKMCVSGCFVWKIRLSCSSALIFPAIFSRQSYLRCEYSIWWSIEFWRKMYCSLHLVLVSCWLKKKHCPPVGDKTPYALQTKLPQNLADPPHTNRCAIHLFFVLCSTNIEFHLVRLYNPGVRAEGYRSIPIILSICRCLESGQGKIAIPHQNWGSAYGVLSPTGASLDSPY